MWDGNTEPILQDRLINMEKEHSQTGNDPYEIKGIYSIHTIKWLSKTARTLFRRGLSLKISEYGQRNDCTGNLIIISIQE